MTTDDPDAWWSPVPGGRPPGPDPAGETAQPHKTHPGATAPDVTGQPSRRGPWPWVVAATTALALVVGLVLVLTVGGPATKTLTDPSGTVSIAVPRAWYDDAGDPGARSDPPVLAASNLWQSRWVEVGRFDVEDGDDLRSFHAEGVAQECSAWSCATRRGPRVLTVAGHQALEQVVTHPSDADEGATTSLTLTVWLDHEAVEVHAVATSLGETPPDAAPLETVAASLRLG